MTASVIRVKAMTYHSLQLSSIITNCVSDLHLMNNSIYLIVLSEEPLTTRRSLYWRHAMPLLCPLRVLTNSHDAVFQTLIVLSPLADTIYFSSKSTTLTAARWPTNTRRNVISVEEYISHTAIERSWEKKNK